MPYPIEQNLPQIKNTLQSCCNLVLTAEPGAGKSTIVPLALLDERWLGGKKILMLQPRRIAAVAIARRMADLSKTRPGELVGHSVRFSSNTGSNTRIEILTEGILTRRLQNDPTLENVGLIIFDEFHERSIHSDICLALCREIQADLRPDLRLLIMSATMDTQLVSEYLPESMCISGKGFLHPVETFYNPVTIGRDRFADFAYAAAAIIKASPPDEEFLFFLPGAGEINKTSEILAEELKNLNFRLLQLHGSMSLQDQEKILEKNRIPRIILSTNIAETSLTIDGITTVIDSGFCRRLDFNSETGLDQLGTQFISRSSAVQRSGRAGRLKPGRAFRLYHQLEFNQMSAEEQPEILRTDPAGAILEICAWGCNPAKFNWLQKPPANAFEAAISLLQKLGAIDQELRITQTGRKMAELPANPRIARMLLYAAENNCLEKAADAAAIISEKDFLLSEFRDGKGYELPDPDLELRLSLLNQEDNPGCKTRTDKATMRRILQISNQFKQMLKRDFSDQHKQQTENVLKALLCAFPDRVCMKRHDSSDLSFNICSGQGLRLCSSGHLKENEMILALKADSKRRAASNEGQIFLACQIKREWLKKLLEKNCRNERAVFFSEEQQKVVVRQRFWYDTLLLEEHESGLRTEEREKASQLLIQAATGNPEISLNLNSEENSSFISRVKIVKSSPSGKEFPDIDSEWLKKLIFDLAPQSISFADLQKVSLEQNYFNQLGWQLREKFERIAPERFEVPSGSSIRILYQREGPPILAVKIQELFGLAQTPAICEKTLPLLLHLLSPAGRPVQITSDLASFWQNGYRQIISELKGRYPKHPWPDDPQKAVAFRGTKKQFERKTGQKF